MGNQRTQVPPRAPPPSFFPLPGIEAIVLRQRIFDAGRINTNRTALVVRSLITRVDRRALPVRLHLRQGLRPVMIDGEETLVRHDRCDFVEVERKEGVAVHADVPGTCVRIVRFDKRITDMPKATAK